MDIAVLGTGMVGRTLAPAFAALGHDVVIGTRLLRETRASAMGIAVGVLMGSQALGAALGGVAASAVGPPRAR